MMGTQEAAPQLFYDFDLEDQVPAGHMLRRIDRFLDCGAMRDQLAPYYSNLGRPSIDPELIIRMLVIGYVMGIRSERRLCEEVHLNLAYRWFCRLGLDSKVPNHSTFSRYRHGKFRDSDMLRLLFEATVERCLNEGLVDGEGFAVDASLIAADANKRRAFAAEDWNPQVAEKVGSRAAREYLDTLDDSAFGAASPTVPKFVAKSDPAAQWTRADASKPFFAYSTNYLIDTQSSVIVDVEATRAIRQAEVGASRTMIDRTEQRFGLRPEWLAGDTAYGSAQNLGWLVEEKHITPFIPVFDKGERTDGTFSRSDFIWDEDNDRYICPKVRSCCAVVATTPTPHANNARVERPNIEPPNWTATTVRSNPNAAPTWFIGPSRGRNTKPPATLHGDAGRPMATKPRATNAKRSRCCLLTSNAS